MRRCYHTVHLLHNKATDDQDSKDPRINQESKEDSYMEKRRKQLCILHNKIVHWQGFGLL